MIGIDCLLKNTVLEKQLRRVVERMAYDKASKGEDASLNGIYNDLAKAKIEVSLRTIGQIYTDAAFPADGPFTSHAEVDQITGRRFTNTVRNLLLMKPKEGEKQMGREALGEHIAGTLADTLFNNLVEDNTTKSTMVKLRDTVMAAAKRLSGELPNKDVPATKENFIDTVQRYIDQEREDGFNTVEGKMNNIHDVMRETLREINSYDKELANDPVRQEQFREYVKEIEDSLHSVLFSRKDAQNVLHDAMKEAGYGKTLKDGRTVLDWKKMAGEIHDLRQLRTNVRDAMEQAGYDPATASRIADSLQKEYKDMKAKTLATATRRFGDMEANMAAGKNTLPRVEVNDMIDKRVDEWENFKKLADDDTKKIAFGRKEAKDILTAALKQEGYGKELPGGKVVLDWTKLSREVKDDFILKNKVFEMLQKQGHSGALADKIATAIDGIYKEMRQDIIDHATNRLDTMQDSIGKERPGHRTELARLVELHDLGLFGGGYERLLNDRLGVDALSQQHMDQLKSIGQKIADLNAEMTNSDGGLNMTRSYAFSVFQREIEHILGDNKDSRSNMMKLAKYTGNMLSLGNVGILSNPYNIAENTISGQQLLKSVRGIMFNEMGKEAFKFKDRSLWWNTLFDVAKGGVEYGDAGDKINHVTDFAKGLNSLNFKKNPIKAAGTAAMLMGRAGLNGMDAANKAVAHKHLGMLAMYQQLTKGNKLTGEEATHFLSEALYGKTFNNAKVEAGTLLDKFGMKNNEATRTRFANDIVKANLTANGLLTPKIIEAAYNSANNVASIGLGHKANNPFSRTLHAGKVDSRKRETDYIKQGDVYHAALERMFSNVYYNGVLKFAGGGMNWAMLRLQNLTGHGIATGISMLNAGNKETFATTPQEYERQMTNRLEASRRIAGGISEMALASIGFAAFYAYGASQDDQKDDESTLETASRHAKDNYVVNRVVNKVGPNMLQLYYLMKKSKGEGAAAAMRGTLKYAENIMNLNPDYSPSGRIVKAGVKLDRGGAKGAMEAYGDLGAILGDMASTPFYRSGKNVVQIANYWLTGDPGENTYTKPMSVWDGLFGGGLLQDMGIYSPSAPIELLPGVGNKVGAEFRAMGIEKVSDLKDHDGWEQKISSKNRKGAQKMYSDLTENPVELVEE